MQPDLRSHSTRSEDLPEEKRRTSEREAIRLEEGEEEVERRKDCFNVNTRDSILVPLGEIRRCRSPRPGRRETKREQNEVSSRAQKER